MNCEEINVLEVCHLGTKENQCCRTLWWQALSKVTQLIRKCLTDSQRPFKTQRRLKVEKKSTLIANAYATKQKGIFTAAKRLKCSMANCSFMALMIAISESKKSLWQDSE